MLYVLIKFAELKLNSFNIRSADTYYGLCARHCARGLILGVDMVDLSLCSWNSQSSRDHRLGASNCNVMIDATEQQRALGEHILEISLRLRKQKKPP